MLNVLRTLTQKKPGGNSDAGPLTGLRPTGARPPRRLISVLRPLLGLVVLTAPAALAAPVLSISPITWNIIGLDSNKQTDGPNQYPVGARVCNTGDVTATGVTATFTLDGGSTNPYISIFGTNTLGVPTLPAGATTATYGSQYTQSSIPANCTDFYFLVAIQRTSAAFSTRGADTAAPSVRNTQLFHISAAASNATTPVNTPQPQELFVEKLVSQGRNAVSGLVGPTTVTVGQSYTYTLDASTGNGGFEQLDAFPLFPNVIFQITNVSTTYTAPTGAVNSSVYADACGWQNTITASSYHNNQSCVGPAYYVGGAGNSIHSVMTVKILSAGTANVSTIINDFSGNSYHYNADYGTKGILAITAVNAPDLSVIKTHTGTFYRNTPGSYTLSVSNAASTSSTSGTVTVTDTLPSGLSATAISGTGWTCTLGTLTCTRTDALASGSSYPPITVTVNVSGSAPSSVTNIATVSGGGDTTSGNNTASDSTAISNLTNAGINKVFNPTSVPQGTTTILTFTLTNTNVLPLTNVNFTDVMSGMSVASVTVGGTCTGVSGAPLLGATSLNLTVASLAASSSCTLTLSVQGNTVGTNPNTTSGATSTQTPAAGAVSNTATLTVTALLTPVVTLSKLVRNIGTVLNPAVQSSTPFGTSAVARPAEYLEYCVSYRNTGLGGVTGLVIRDAINSSNTAQVNGYGGNLGVYAVSGLTVVAGDTSVPVGTPQSSTGTLTGTNLSYSVGALFLSGQGVVCFKTQVY